MERWHEDIFAPWIYTALSCDGGMTKTISTCPEVCVHFIFFFFLWGSSWVQTLLIYLRAGTKALKTFFLKVATACLRGKPEELDAKIWIIGVSCKAQLL